MADARMDSEGLPARSSWVPFPQACSDWSELFKAPVPAHSPLNSHPALTAHPKPCWIAIKRVDLGLRRYPHDVKKEAAILRALDHPNIVPLLACAHTSPTFSLYLPLYVLTLTRLLHSSAPEFTPTLPAFFFLSKHILRHLASGLAYLHERGVAHRDVGPSNVVFDRSGQPVWIDFGTAWSPETAEEDGLEFELGTMPYRAPELLFGSRHYSPQAIDCWSLGVLLAELFTPLTPRSPSPPQRAQSRPPAMGDHEGLFSFALEEQDGTSVMDWYTGSVSRLEEEESWRLPEINGDIPVAEPEVIQAVERKTLFVGHLGDIGLVGSIFKILGTPDVSTWPEAENLPDFFKLSFHSFPPQPLSKFLPYTKKTSPNPIKKHEDDDDENKDEENNSNQIIQLISKLLVYQSTDRFNAFQVLSHPWLKDLEEKFDGKSFGDWMKLWISPCLEGGVECL